MAQVYSPPFGNQGSPFGLGIHPHRRRRFHEIDPCSDAPFQQAKRCRVNMVDVHSEEGGNNLQNSFSISHQNKRSRQEISQDQNNQQNFSISSAEQLSRDHVDIDDIRRQFGAALAERDSRVNALEGENSTLKQELCQYQNEVVRLQEENKILKKAVQLQNAKFKDAENTIQSQQQTLIQAGEHIKKLEQANYGLRVHLEAKSNSEGFSSFDHRPPDVF